MPKFLDVHRAMDNDSTHKTPSMSKGLARHARFHAHFSPTSASWHHKLEWWFAALTHKHFRGGTYCSSRQCEQTTRRYIKINKHDPKSLV